MRRALAALIGSWVLAMAPLAAADAVPSGVSEPDCPDGASGSRHSGQCTVYECGSAGECTEGYVCRGSKLCVREGTNGRTADPVLQTNETCSTQADCNSGYTCRTLRVCADESGCNAGGAVGLREGVVAAGAGILIVLAAAARRRRAKR